MLRTYVGSRRHVTVIYISSTFHAGFEEFLPVACGHLLKVNGLAVSPASAFPTFDHRPKGDAEQP